MDLFVRSYLGVVGILITGCGLIFIWLPNREPFLIIAGIIAFIVGGGLLGIALFSNHRSSD